MGHQLIPYYRWEKGYLKPFLTNGEVIKIRYNGQHARRTSNVFFFNGVIGNPTYLKYLERNIITDCHAIIREIFSNIHPYKLFTNNLRKPLTICLLTVQQCNIWFGISLERLFQSQKILHWWSQNWFTVRVMQDTPHLSIDFEIIEWVVLGSR